MSSGEDFGPLMDVLVTCVGAMDVISVLALICNSGNVGGGSSNESMDINNNVKAFVSDKIRDKSPLATRPMIIIDKSDNNGSGDDVINSLLTKVNELEAKVEELEVRSRENSMERFLDEERERLKDTDRLRRSQSPTPDHSTFLEHENESHESDESHGSEISQKSVPRDDCDLDEAIKRSSQVSPESREEEMNDMDDCAQLVNRSDIDADGDAELHLIESIKEIPISPREIESTDVNENFIQLEKMQTQTQSPKMLMKQANVSSEDFPEETINELEGKESDLPIQATAEHITEHANVSSHPKIEKFPKSSEIKASADETASDLISTQETQFESISVTKTEDLSCARPEPTVMVQNYEKVLDTETFREEKVIELLPPQPQNIEVISEPQSVIGSLMDVNVNPSINLQTKDTSISANSSTMNLNVSTASLQSGNTSLASAALDNDYAVRRMTPEPDVSIDVRESSIEKELLSVGEGLRRTKRCINSLDRSASRSSSRLSRHSKKSKSPSVASEEDYKEWFDKFDNHLSSELTLPENDDEEEEKFDSDMEEELLMDADVGNLDGADICNIDEDRDVSVSITLNLKQKQSKEQQEEEDKNECHPCKDFQEPKIFKTKAEELEEMHRNWESTKGGGRRRLSILPSTEEQQKSYVSMLHPEEFTASIGEPHQHHKHLHNVGYSEWMKKIVDHHSCHLALSDSESDSDVPLDEVQMLPLFCDEKAKKKQNRRRKK